MKLQSRLKLAHDRCVEPAETIARLEALIRTVAPRQARDLLEMEDAVRTEIPRMRDRQELRELRRLGQTAEADRLYSEALWEFSTLIDLTFGAQWIAGRLFVKDAAVDPDYWTNRYEIRNGVALDRPMAARAPENPRTIPALASSASA